MLLPNRAIFGLILAVCCILTIVSGTEASSAQQLQIDRQLFFTTVRIEAFINSGVLGGGGSTGTGFIVSEVYADNKNRTFLVTCAHVIHGMSGLKIVFVARSKDGGPDYAKFIELKIDDLPTAAFLHPDPAVDIAVIPITMPLQQLEKAGTSPFYRSLNYQNSQSASDAVLSALQNVIFIGYPRGIIDAKNLSPLARRGSTATPIDLDFNGQPFFMIDAAVFNGSSGSPVFAYDDGTIRGRDNATSFGTRAVFLGMISQAYFVVEKGAVKFTSQPTAESKRGAYTDSYGLNLGLVIKERTIFELLDMWHRANRVAAPIRLKDSAATVSSPAG